VTAHPRGASAAAVARRTRRLAAALALLGALAGCAAPPSRPDAGATLHAFVVLGAEGRAVARAITAQAACPAIDVDGNVQPMAVRAAAATMPLRPTVSAAADSKPSAFPVLACEFVLPDGARSAAVGGRALPLPRARPERVVVIGDTGCRLKSGDRVFQACNDGAAWPFATVAAAAAAYRPDVVIHVGDYHYRENACPPGDAGCAGSPWGYGWDTWEADLFAPARELLAAAPWVFVRGNHESCRRAGQGWWRFLDPRPLERRQDCNDPADDATGDYSEPYAVPLGGAGTDAQFIVFDSSLAGVAPLAPSSAMYGKYRAQLERAFALAARRPQTFFINHHPILAFAPNVADSGAPHAGNRALQSVLESLQPTVLFPPTVQALLAGHVHLFEVVTFSTPHPPQFVSGNGGDWIDPPLPTPFPAAAMPAPGAVVTGLVATDRFGFMTMERDGAGWRMTARDARGAPMTACALSGRKAGCTPPVAP
jgi:hypothetical protein